jgi:hypothetical protein
LKVLLRMEKDKRVIRVKQLIESGSITKFIEIYDVITVTMIVKLLKTNHQLLTVKNSNPILFNLKTVYKIAEYFEVPATKIFELIDNQLKEKQKKKR